MEFNEMMKNDYHVQIDRDLSDIKSALDQAAIVAITDRTGKITFVNDLFVEVSQYSKEEIIGKDHRMLNSGRHSKEFFKNMWATIGQGKMWHGELCNRKKDGSLYWLDTKIVPFLNEKGIPYKYIAIRNEITKKKQLEKAFKKSTATYQVITDNSIDFISVVDEKGKFYYASPSHEKILGYKLSDISSRDIYSIVVKADQPHIKEFLNQARLSEGSVVSNEFRIQDIWGKVIYVEARIDFIQDTGEYKGKNVLVIRDITKRREADLKIHDLADNDQLTLLPNRSSFRKKLYLEVEKAVKYDAILGVALLSIDRLRNVNDSFGHEVGDYYLSVVANRLKEVFSEEGCVARLGGDEFAFIIRDMNDVEKMEQFVEEVRKYVVEPLDIQGQMYTPSVSIGISFSSLHSNISTELMTLSEKAHQNVKARGGNGYEIYLPGTVEKSLERILLENELRKSIALGLFNLDYQPKVNMKSGKVIGVEALVRWNHPELGRIPPNQFIPLAEETKLILPLGEWVLREACKQAKEWQRYNHKEFRVAVNVSAIQLEDENIVKTIKAILDEVELSPEFIEIELTESAFANKEGSRMKIKELRELGFLVSIDDFGTGYSTFSYIKELPVDTIKIDMAFTKDIHKNEESRAIVQAIVSLSNAVGLNVIAEGIENEEQVRVLVECGCYQGQGYYYSKPISGRELEDFMQKSQGVNKYSL
ncbi:sensor domain-containing protein [Sporosarcina sp. CAU 1771]